MRHGKKVKLPTDINKKAKSIVDLATSESEDTNINGGKNPAAVALGRLGGKRGGMARADSLTPERRAEIAKKAAQSRWNKA